MSNKVTTGSRLLLGAIYFVFGLNGFLQFLPMPPPPEQAAQFFGALFATGYFLPVLKGTEVLMSLLLLSGIAAPAALVVLAPITIQIFLFHAFLTPGLHNLVLPVVMIVLHVASAVAYGNLYRPLFQKR